MGGSWSHSGYSVASALDLKPDPVTVALVPIAVAGVPVVDPAAPITTVEATPAAVGVNPALALAQARATDPAVLTTTPSSNQ